ncbi:hypothetical protein QL285_062811 [Trifolium repens]|nr:hypothetical protein QL285_062811 [Trifolium repens]
MQSLRGLQPTSNQSESQTKPPVSQNKPSESQTNTLSTVTATCDASKIHKVNDDEDSEATPQTPSPRKDTSPQKSIFFISPNTLKQVALPEADQSKPASPPPPVTKTPSKNQPTPEPEQQPRQQPNPEPNSTIIIHIPDPTDETHHVAMDNTFT